MDKRPAVNQGDPSPGIKNQGVYMNPNIIKRNDLLAQKVIKGLKSRNMEGFYAHDKE